MQLWFLPSEGLVKTQKISVSVIKDREQLPSIVLLGKLRLLNPEEKIRDSREMKGYRAMTGMENDNKDSCLPSVGI